MTDVLRSAEVRSASVGSRQLVGRLAGEVRRAQVAGADRFKQVVYCGVEGPFASARRSPRLVKRRNFRL